MPRLKIGYFALGALLVANLAVEGGKLMASAHAAPRAQYKIVAYDENNREAVLNQLAQEGWELVVVEPRYGGFILERQ